MIDVVMSVCGDEKYFEMSKISIPSFLRSNPSAKLHVFTDKPKEIEPSYKCEVYDFDEALKAVDKEQLFSLSKTPKDFANNGVTHHHLFVSALPLVAQRVCSSELILKIDVDSYFAGDMMKCVEGFKEVDADLFLIERKREDIMKLYAGLPGVGFCMWRKDGKFIDQYVERHNGHEQQTILDMHMSEGIRSCEIQAPNFHICYPFLQSKRLGKKLTKKDLDCWIPFYVHVSGEDEPQLDKLKRLDKWYADTNQR